MCQGNIIKHSKAKGVIISGKIIHHYSCVHKWMNKQYNKPEFCEMCGTENSKIFHWANISGEYKYKRVDWLRLCEPCHIIFDDRLPLKEKNPFYGKKHTLKSLSKMSISKRGKHYSPETEFKKGMAGTWIDKKLSPEHRAKAIKTLIPFKKGHPGYWLGKKRPDYKRKEGYQNL